MQPVKDPPLGQRDHGIGLPLRVVLQRMVRVYEALVLLLERHDPRREQAPEAEAVPLREGERRVLVVPGVVEDVGAALVHDAGAAHGGAGARRGGGRGQEPADLRRPPGRRMAPHHAGSAAAPLGPMVGTVERRTPRWWCVRPSFSETKREI